MGTTFESLSRGLNEAVAHAKGKKIVVKTYKPKAVDVSALRQRMGMTQGRAVWFFQWRRCAIGNAEIVLHKVLHSCC